MAMILVGRGVVCKTTVSEFDSHRSLHGFMKTILSGDTPAAKGADCKSVTSDTPEVRVLLSRPK